jgi:hypothetical protein
MTTESVLFILRVASGLLLLAMMGGLFIVLWRDYRSTALRAQFSRRVYGQMIEMQRVDDMYAPTGSTYPLQPLTSLGRSPTNNIVIEDSFASNEHAIIMLRDGRWWLEDRNSRNGTLLNEDPIQSAVIVTDGDIIGIGNTSYKLVFNS